MSKIVKSYGDLEMYETSSGRYSIYIVEQRGHINIGKNLNASEASAMWDKLIKEGWYESLDDDLFSDDLAVRKVSRFTNDVLTKKIEVTKEPDISELIDRYMNRRNRSSNRFVSREKELPALPNFKIREY